MLTSLEWISAVKSVTCVQSDYAVAKILGVTKASIYSIRQRRTHLGIDTARRVAEELEVDPSIVYISAQIERSKTPEEFEMWSGIYERLGGPQVDEDIKKLLNDRVMQAACKFVRIAA